MVTSLQQELENLCPPKRGQDLCSPMCSGWFSMPSQCWLEQTDGFTPFCHHGQLKVSLVCLKACWPVVRLSQGTRKQCCSGSFHSQNSLDYHLYVLFGQCRREEDAGYQWESSEWESHRNYILKQLEAMKERGRTGPGFAWNGWQRNVKKGGWGLGTFVKSKVC